MSHRSRMDLLAGGSSLPSVLLDTKVVDLNRWSTQVDDKALALLAKKNQERLAKFEAMQNKARLGGAGGCNLGGGGGAGAGGGDA